MGAEALSGSGGSRPRGKPPRAAGFTKSGKPRPGTGGEGRRKLEGKGPTPPAAKRPGHPAQRRAAGSGASRSGSGADSRPSGSGAPPRPARTQRGAGDAAEFVAGRNAVVESLRASVPAAVLYVGARVQHDERVSEAIKLAADRGVVVLEAGAAELDRLTGGALHQGLALKVRAYNYAHPDDLLARAVDAAQPPLIVALDGVTDPRNLGAIARSAAAFGAHGVVVPSRRGAGVTAGAWKASAGALARVPVAQVPNLARALAAYQQAGLFVVGLDAGGDTPIEDLAVADAPLAIVVGSEGRGLSRLVAERCDVLARIPMAADTESLNAGVAAGIALHAVTASRAARS